MANATPKLIYVAEMLVELRKLAIESREPMLAHLLAMAELEARNEPPEVCSDAGRVPLDTETKCFQKL
ncbi:hypothetical protein D5400_01595 [Georhizobium profundi]|uniref:Uncharacterized protein n=1 Tax=Georhizobium profundi TaxID=2341112 RepID=A0A3Q8XL61_9HYPH|nr:hypothetical protein D5400_01595 [Georhizobium profundi]